jgi:hypothetical protein
MALRKVAILRPAIYRHSIYKVTSYRISRLIKAEVQTLALARHPISLLQ